MKVSTLDKYRAWSPVFLSKINFLVLAVEKADKWSILAAKLLYFSDHYIRAVVTGTRINRSA